MSSFGITSVRPPRPVGGALSAVVVMVGCAAEPGTDGRVVATVDTIGATEVVRNSGTPPEWNLIELAAVGRLGAGGGEPAPDEFGRIAGVVADDGGRIYVADAMAKEIRVFDESGGFLFRFGREGAGPGEIRALQSMAWLGDTLAVLDAGNGRVGLFTRDGDWAGQRPFMALTGPEIRLHGRAYGELYMPFLRRTAEGGNLVFVRHTAAGPTDTLMIRRNPRATDYSVTCTHEPAISFYTADFAPAGLNVPAPGGTIATVWTAEYRIPFVNPHDDTVRVIERDMPPVSFTDAEWAEEKRKYEEWRESLRPSPSIGDCEPGTLPRPETREMVRAITFDEQGRTWIERTTPPGVVYDVFDAEGRLIAELPAPPRFTRHVPFIRGNRVYVVQRDSLDIESVHVFAVNGEPD